MNYLQLAQRLREKVGGAGDGTPTSVKGQKGESLLLVNYINEAWIEIQSIRQWSWMHKTVTTKLVAGTQTYNENVFGILNFGEWDLRDIKLYDAGLADETVLSYIGYDAFRRAYTVGVQQQGRPVYVSMNKANDLVFAQVPDKPYTVNADYYESPQELIAGTDIPSMPKQFHLAIVYLAMQYYGLYENAPEVVRDGMTQYNKVMNRLETHQLPEITLGSPLY